MREPVPVRSADVIDFGGRPLPDKEVVTVARIEGVDPGETAKQVRTVLDAQAEKWGGPLLNHLLYARRPTIFRGARAMWGGLHASGLLDPALVALVNRRIASLNGCEF
jgi:alkylhydroperoxidase family enzyme